MKEVFPKYYEKFQCIADRCRHNCCIGWEIDIDEDTMALYQSLEGEFADKIRSHIEGKVPHFILRDGERCPFLNERGLCDIILRLGDGAICDICYLHPRFSNFYDEFTETGLGLCCEEAARLILTEQEKLSIDIPNSVKNDEFFIERNEVFAILQDRRLTMYERLCQLCRRYGYEFHFNNEELYDFYMSLERLDKSWEEELKKLKMVEGKDIFKREDLQIFFEQLACYFVFRHFNSGVELAILSCWVLGAICSSGEDMDQMIDIIRMYSSEIEYSEENTEKINHFLRNKDRMINHP